MSKVTMRRGVRYKTYFFRERDPIINKVMTEIDDSGMTFKDVNKTSRVSTGTLSNWRNRHTRRPQFCTVAAVLGSCGKEVAIVDKKHR